MEGWEWRRRGVVEGMCGMRVGESKLWNGREGSGGSGDSFFGGGGELRTSDESGRKRRPRSCTTTPPKNEWATGDNKKFTEGVTRGRCDCKLSAKLGKISYRGKCILTGWRRAQKERGMSSRSSSSRRSINPQPEGTAP